MYLLELAVSQQLCLLLLLFFSLRFPWKHADIASPSNCCTTRLVLSQLVMRSGIVLSYQKPTKLSLIRTRQKLTVIDGPEEFASCFCQGADYF